MKVKRGNIIYLTSQSKPDGSVQGYLRPYLVVSNDIGNKYSTICIAVPLKLAKKHKQPTHTTIKYNKSIALCEQIKTINQNNIKN